MKELNVTKLIDEKTIQKRISEMGRDLSRQYEGEKIIAICVLRGAFMFYSDLIRQIQAEVACEFLGVTSYGMSDRSSGEVKITLDISAPIRGCHVLLVEDIVDSGLTMNFLTQTLKAREPKSLTTVTFLHKPAATKVACQMDYIGFEIPNDFVVGYGLDYQDLYRELPYIAQIELN